MSDGTLKTFIKVIETYENILYINLFLNEILLSKTVLICTKTRIHDMKRLCNHY